MLQTLAVIFLICLLMNIPIAISLGIACLVFTIFFTSFPVDLITQAMMSALDTMPLLAVPFFILTGDLMMEGGISKRLIGFCDALIGKVTGSLGLVTIAASMIFAAISGSGPATVACIGGITIPAMKEENYGASFASTIACVSGTLGPLIPPSISFIMYGIICEVSITDLFIAGIVPGILIAIVLMVWVRVTIKTKNIPIVRKAKNVKLWPAFKEAFWSLLIPVLILGGIYGGVVTPTEAAVVAVVASLVIGIFVYRELNFKTIFAAFKRTVLTSGTFLILVSTATAFGRLLTIGNVPQSIAASILGITSNKIIILLLINVFLLVVGMFIDTTSAIILLAPLLLGVVLPLGITPLHFGVIMVVNLVIGMSTPPVGTSLFVATRIGGVKMDDMVKWLIPAIVIMFLVQLLITYSPPIAIGFVAFR